MNNNRPGPNPLAKILRALNLTDEQKASIKQFLTEYQPCHRAAMLALRNAQKVIIEAANIERREIMAALKDGTIDRRIAAQQLGDLNKRVRLTLQSDEAVQAALAAVKACDEELMAKIKAILTEEQKIKLARILGGIRK
jgi:hypothetical protein